MSQNLISMYRNVVFVIKPEFKPPDSFAIITAHNPLGQILTEEDNIERNRALEEKLHTYPYQIIIGAAPDLSHQEPSFALACPKTNAIKIAREFQQNAIYWIEYGQLWLEPVILSFTPLHLGQFRDFTRLA